MSHLVRVMDGWSAAWATLMLRACWQGGLALLAAWLVCRLWRGLPPSGKVWVWRAAYLKLMIAFVWITPLALRVLHPPAVARELGSPPNRASAVQWQQQPSALILPPRPSGSPAYRRFDAAKSAPTAPRPMWWRAALMAIWLVGACVCLIAVARQWAAARRLIATSRTIENLELLSHYRRVARAVGVRDAPPLRVGPTASPLLIGLI